jgi:hypothetical protein
MNASFSRAVVVTFMFVAGHFDLKGAGDIPSGPGNFYSPALERNVADFQAVFGGESLDFFDLGRVGAVFCREFVPFNRGSRTFRPRRARFGFEDKRNFDRFVTRLIAYTFPQGLSFTTG